RCRTKKAVACFKRIDDGVCRACIKKGEAAAARTRALVPAPALPTIDVVIGRERNGRIVRVVRVDGVVRLLAGVRLDDTAIHTLGTFTVPLRFVAELPQALR